MSQSDAYDVHIDNLLSLIAHRGPSALNGLMSSLSLTTNDSQFTIHNFFQANPGKDVDVFHLSSFFLKHPPDKGNQRQSYKPVT